MANVHYPTAFPHMALAHRKLTFPKVLARLENAEKNSTAHAADYWGNVLENFYCGHCGHQQFWQVKLHSFCLSCGLLRQ